MNGRFYALVIKESLQIIRDPSSILIACVLPLMLLFLYGYGVSLDLDLLKIGVCMEDSSESSQTFVQSLKNSTYFDVTIERTREPLYQKLEKGEIRGIVVIPSYFSSFRQTPDLIAPIQVIADASEANTANFVQNYVQGVFQNWLHEEVFEGQMKAIPAVKVTPRFWYNEQLESRYFLLSGSLGIIMTLIGSLLTALVVAREWERGTMESLIATEVTKIELILGKVLPYFLLGLVSMGICVFITKFYFSIPLRGSLVWIFISTCSFLFCALGTGLLISTFSKVQMVACQIAIVAAFLPAYVLSGFLFEISSMPPIIRYLTYLMPARYFVQNLQTLFLTGNVLSLLITNVLSMLGFAFCVFALTLKKTTKRLN